MTETERIVGAFLSPEAEMVLAHHQRVDIRGCLCGWSELGLSHPRHVLTQLLLALFGTSIFEDEAARAAPQPPTSDEPWVTRVRILRQIAQSMREAATIMNPADALLYRYEARELDGAADTIERCQASHKDAATEPGKHGCTPETNSDSSPGNAEAG